MLQLITRIFISFFLLAALGSAANSQSQKAQDCSSGTQLTLAEAELILYFSPAGSQLRRSGFEIGWSVEEGGALTNQTDYYHFRAVNSERKSSGSSLVGNFAVNKHNGDLWNEDSDPYIVTSKQLNNIQSIVREAKGLSKEDVARYRNLPLIQDAAAKH